MVFPFITGFMSGLVGAVVALSFCNIAHKTELESEYDELARRYSLLQSVCENYKSQLHIEDQAYGS